MEVGIRRLEYVNHVSRSSVINDISRYRKGEKYALIKSQIILFAFPFKLHLDLQYVWGSQTCIVLWKGANIRFALLLFIMQDGQMRLCFKQGNNFEVRMLVFALYKCFYFCVQTHCDKNDSIERSLCHIGPFCALSYANMNIYIVLIFELPLDILARRWSHVWGIGRRGSNCDSNVIRSLRTSCKK